MRSVAFVVTLAVALLGTADSLTSYQLGSHRVSLTERYAYVPDGFKSAEEYQKFREKEQQAVAAKNLGKLGPRGFKSRSFRSFQEALERGEAAHLMPVFNAKEKLQKGQIKLEDIPYMQRGGAWDQSDVKGATKRKWLPSDKQYAAGGYMKEQSVSIFGVGAGLDWTGTRARSGPEGIPGRQNNLTKNYKAPNVYNMKGVNAPKTDEQPKKLFGLF